MANLENKSTADEHVVFSEIIRSYYFQESPDHLVRIWGTVGNNVFKVILIELSHSSLSSKENN